MPVAAHPFLVCPRCQQMRSAWQSVEITRSAVLRHLVLAMISFLVVPVVRLTQRTVAVAVVRRMKYLLVATEVRLLRALLVRLVLIHCQRAQVVQVRRVRLTAIVEIIMAVVPAAVE